MHKFLFKFAGFFVLLAGTSTAQTTGATRIYTVPDGLGYQVDGSYFRTATMAVWPAGTKHVLSLNPSQDGGVNKSRYKFQSWQYGSGGVVGPLPPGATVMITADPSLNEFFATFQIEHALSLFFASCSPEIPCQSPGTVYVNGVAYTSDAEIYFTAGSAISLMAQPADGYIFTGWDSNGGQTALGFLNTVVLNTPTIVRPHFQLARRINFATAPAGLDVLADRARLSTPNTLQWAIGTTHTIGVPSPQASKDGAWWVFTNWSDGGVANHAYTVGPGAQETLTATFVPATVTDLKTSPAGLALKVDGRDNWPNYYFPWAAGEVHRLEAAAQQTDDKGRIWNFTSWSNGGARVQDYTVPPSAAPGETVHLTANYTAVGHLVVTSAVAGVTVKVDGADCATPCDMQKPVGTAVRVSAPESIVRDDNSRFDFDGWPGSGSAAGDWTVTLGADPVTPYLTYHTMNRLVEASDPAEGAAWRVQPASPDGFYDALSTVIVSVTAQPGFRFKRWAGDASGTAPLARVAMNTPRLVEAVLDRVPYIAPAGVANGAGTTPESSVAAGSIVSIFGASFAPDTIVGTDAPLAQALGCVTVRIGDRMLPLFFVSPTQINVQLPDDTPIGDQRLTVSCQGLPDVQATFTVERNAPGLFQDPKSAGAVVHEDGSAVTADAPAKPGELLTIYGTGFGPTDRGRPFGFPALAATTIVDAVTVMAGDVAVPAESAFAVAGRIGVDAAQFRLPDGVAGVVSVRVTVNGKSSNTVGIPASGS